MDDLVPPNPKEGVKFLRALEEVYVHPTKENAQRVWAILERWRKRKGWRVLEGGKKPT